MMLPWLAVWQAVTAMPGRMELDSRLRQGMETEEEVTVFQKLVVKDTPTRPKEALHPVLLLTLLQQKRVQLPRRDKA